MTMVWLAKRLREHVTDSRVLIITDRTELDDQIASTYTNCGRANSKTDQASSGDTLRRMLRDQSRRYVFGLIQKYRERVAEPYSEREDIIVISDEVYEYFTYGDVRHVSPGGFDGAVAVAVARIAAGEAPEAIAAATGPSTSSMVLAPKSDFPLALTAAMAASRAGARSAAPGSAASSLPSVMNRVP